MKANEAMGGELKARNFFCCWEIIREKERETHRVCSRNHSVAVNYIILRQQRGTRFSSLVQSPRCCCWYQLVPMRSFVCFYHVLYFLSCTIRRKRKYGWVEEAILNLYVVYKMEETQSSFTQQQVLIRQRYYFLMWLYKW